MKNKAICENKVPSNLVILEFNVHSRNKFVGINVRKGSENDPLRANMCLNEFLDDRAI